MKKLSILAVAVLALSFASCKKERACECTVTTTSTTTTSTTNTITFEKISKSDAKFACQKRTTVNTPSQGNATTTVSDCKLK